jgi:hypothetical protein
MSNEQGNSAGNPPSDLDLLAERLSRLENENRIGKHILLPAVFLFGLGFLLLGTMVVFGKKYDYIAERLAAKELLVLDNENKPVIALAGMAGKPAMIFHDRRGNSRALFSLTEEGSPAISFLDENRVFRSTMKLNRDGNPGVDFFDNTGRLRARFGIIDLPGETVPALALMGREGEGGSTAVLVSSENEGAVLELTDGTGTTNTYR